MREWLERWFDDLPETEEPARLVGPLLTFNNYVATPWRDGDVDVLVAENQGVWLWGRDDLGAYRERENEDGVPWRVVDEDAEAFWLHHGAFEASIALPAQRNAHGPTADEVDRIVGATEPLPCGAWAWPGDEQTVRVRDRSVVVVCRVDGGHTLSAAAPTEEELAWLDSLDVEWDGLDSRESG